MSAQPPPYRGHLSLGEDKHTAKRDPSLWPRPLNLSEGRSYARLPLNDECVAHLKFLTVLGHLRKETSETDGLFGIKDASADSFGVDRPKALAKIREKRWSVYVARAVLRFERWFFSLDHRPDAPSNALKVSDLVRTSLNLDDFTRLPGQKLDWEAKGIPPLDVLMVLHSFMLNPWCFLEDCMRASKMKLWHAGFPWSQVDACIDPETFIYTPKPIHVAKFESSTFQTGENLDGSLQKGIQCPRCSKKVLCAWTDGIFGGTIEEAFENGTGFTDKSFRVNCEGCNLSITQDILRVVKFTRDLDHLRQYSLPLPGTVLTVDGGLKTSEKEDTLFPNRLLLKEQRLTDLAGPGKIQDANMSAARKIIEKVLKDAALVRGASDFHISVLHASQKLSIRRMMSRYWENSSPFALDLVGAVLRQGVFVEKMNELDWIHSPALDATVARLIKKYGVFMGIMAMYPKEMAVPTLDVDLAWHTNQLLPATYFNFCITTMDGKFTNHDDKIDESSLSKAFEWTSRKYQEIAQERYSECTCWYCEAVRESYSHPFSILSSAKLALSKPKRSGSNMETTKAPLSCDDGPHISAHNAVQIQTHVASRVRNSTRRKLENAFDRAVKRAQQNGTPPPRRNEHVRAQRWGESWDEEPKAPYLVNPCITGSMYAANPTCMNTSAGAAGACVKGACGGGVSFGSCGAGAGAACGSGGGAACASGGWGGGGCGGGGGGGGGCGGGGS